MHSRQREGALTGAFSSIEEIEVANREAGHHFFGEGTLRFFNSEIYPTIYDGRYFVTGERFDHSCPERFTIRVALDNGHVETVGEFQAFETRGDAVGAVVALL